MDFYQKLVNIRGNDIENEIRESLKVTSEYYKNLTKERTCLVYASKVYEELRSRGVSCQMIDTNSLEVSYSHYFVLVPCNKEVSYLVDPTYEQFCDNNSSKVAVSLLEDGYVKVDEALYYDYINSINIKKSTRRK